MNKKDLYPSLFFISLSIFVCWQSIDLGFGGFGKPGPGFFSFLSGLILGFLAIIIFFKSQLVKGLCEKISDRRISWKPLIITFSSLVGFFLLIQALGFNLTTFLFIGILLRSVGKKTWTLSVLFALGATLTVYVLFGLILQCRLPKGPLGFFGF